MQDFKFELDPMLRNGAPSYRFFKLAFTAALRLKLELPLDKVLHIKAEGSPTTAAEYKGRVTYSGQLVIEDQAFNDLVFVVDQSRTPVELVTFWKQSQRGETSGAKTGAHPFAEAYMGYLTGKTLENQCFLPAKVIEIADEYNSEPTSYRPLWAAAGSVDTGLSF